jgi:hypothetical protein
MEILLAELEKTNRKLFYDTVKNEYLKVTIEYPVNFDKEFDIRGVVYFNNSLFKGVFWHSNMGSGFCFYELRYGLFLPKEKGAMWNPSKMSFNTKKEAELYLKKTKRKDFPDKTIVKIKKDWEGAWMDTDDLCQLKELTTVLSFKKTEVTVLKWYEEEDPPLRQVDIDNYLKELGEKEKRKTVVKSNLDSWEDDDDVPF